MRLITGKYGICRYSLDMNNQTCRIRINQLVSFNSKNHHIHDSLWWCPTRNGAPETSMLQHISSIKATCTFMHVSCMKHYFHQWNIHELCMVQNISIALHKTCVTGTTWYLAWTMHEVSHHITLIRSSCLADLKKCETLRKLQCTK